MLRASRGESYLFEGGPFGGRLPLRVGAPTRIMPGESEFSLPKLSHHGCDIRRLHVEVP